MKHLLSVLVLVWASVAWGQEVKLPAEIKGAPGSWIIVAPEKIDGGEPRWRIDPGLQEVRLDLLLPPDMLSKLKGKVVTGATGRYKVESWNAKGDKASDISTCWVVIGDAPPVPPGPLPPIPPTPVPPVPPTPVPTKSFRVIFIMETAKTPTKEQISAMYGKDVRDYLALNTTKESGQPGYRHWDQNTTAESESPTMKALWDAITPQITTLPCVAVEVNGKVEIVPLGATPAAMVATFEKYRGGK